MQRLIDANALKKRLMEKRSEIEKARRYGWEFASNGINAAIMLTGCEAAEHTIDAEPVRHGKWVFNPSDAIEAMFTNPKCSECGFESADGGNYCPNCGADMRGESNE